MLGRGWSSLSYNNKSKFTINKITFIYIASRSCTIHRPITILKLQLPLHASIKKQTPCLMLIKYCFELANI